MDENDYKAIKVSIITVCYNSETTIQRTIQSVLAQTYPNIEYIIVDGKSSDNTVEIIKANEPSFNGRMKWISESDCGIYDAMNKGIAMSSGELIGIINSDDYYENDAVEMIVSAMVDTPYQILYGCMRTLSRGKEISVLFNSHENLDKEMIAHPTCFVTKKVYEDFGVFNLRYISAADYDFMLRMKQNNEVRFIPVHEIIANFSLGGMCASHWAYLDLLLLKKDYGMLTKREYLVAKFKAKIAHRFKR